MSTNQAVWKSKSNVLLAKQEPTPMIYITGVKMTGQWIILLSVLVLCYSPAGRVSS